MKRLLLVVALALVATSGLAQTADRDVLVTPDGTVYTVETQIPSTSSSVAATQLLSLSIQNGADVQRTVVPESLLAGYHFGGALAYDSNSKTLFVLWIHMPNGMSSELLLASYRGGNWQPAVSIDDQSYHLRTNLRVGITRRVPQLQSDGSYADVPALLLHALWWDDSGSGQQAKYAMLTIDQGVLASPAEIHSLSEFVSPDDNTYNSVDATFNAEILRHPAIVSSPMQDTVDVVFGDAKTNAFRILTLHPIADVRIHIPVGVGGGGTSGGRPALSIAAPPSFSADWTGPITVLAHDNRFVFANAGDTSLNYITYANGAWTGISSIAIDYRFPAEAALAAVDKMLSTQ
jgi:hypothetical protein